MPIATVITTSIAHRPILNMASAPGSRICSDRELREGAIGGVRPNNVERRLLQVRRNLVVP